MTTPEPQMTRVPMNIEPLKAELRKALSRPSKPACSQDDHDDLPVTSICCGATSYYGFCKGCGEHTGWVRHCDECDFEVEAEELDASIG